MKCVQNARRWLITIALSAALAVIASGCDYTSLGKWK